MRWIKALEKEPDKSGSYFIRDDKGEMYVCHFSKEKHNQWKTSGAGYVLLRPQVEWLDESSGWVSVEVQPEIGGEYNVVWDLEDGDEPVVSTMEWDGVNKKWVDVIGGSHDQKPKVLFWMPLPDKP